VVGVSGDTQSKPLSLGLIAKEWYVSFILHWKRGKGLVKYGSVNDGTWGSLIDFAITATNEGEGM